MIYILLGDRMVVMGGNPPEFRNWENRKLERKKKRYSLFFKWHWYDELGIMAMMRFFLLFILTFLAWRAVFAFKYLPTYNQIGIVGFNDLNIR